MLVWHSWPSLGIFLDFIESKPDVLLWRVLMIEPVLHIALGLSTYTSVNARDVCDAILLCMWVGQGMLSERASWKHIHTQQVLKKHSARAACTVAIAADGDAGGKWVGRRGVCM